MAVDSPLGVNVSDHADFQFTEKAPVTGVPGVHTINRGHEPQGISPEMAAKFAAQVGPKAAETLSRHGFGPDGQLLTGQHPAFGSSDTLQAVEHLAAGWKKTRPSCNRSWGNSGINLMSARISSAVSTTPTPRKTMA